MSLADHYAERGANAIESACSGDDVVLSASDPGEYKRLAREAQALLLKDFKDALAIIDAAVGFIDGGWSSEANQFMKRIKAQSEAATVIQGVDE